MNRRAWRGEPMMPLHPPASTSPADRRVYPELLKVRVNVCNWMFELKILFFCCKIMINLEPWNLTCWETWLVVEFIDFVYVYADAFIQSDLQRLRQIGQDPYWRGFELRSPTWKVAIIPLHYPFSAQFEIANSEFGVVTECIMRAECLPSE